ALLRAVVADELRPVRDRDVPEALAPGPFAARPLLLACLLSFTSTSSVVGGFAKAFLAASFPVGAVGSRGWAHAFTSGPSSAEDGWASRTRALRGCAMPPFFPRARRSWCEGYSGRDDGRRETGMSGTVEKAILAGGCFWGMQDLIRKRPGVISTRV